MTRKFFILLVAATITLAGCKSKSSNTTDNPDTGDTTTMDVVHDDPEDYDIPEEQYEGDTISNERLEYLFNQTKHCVDSINMRKQQVERELKKLSSTADADSCYARFKEAQKASCDYLNSLNAEWLYEPMYTARYEVIVATVEKADMEVQGIGEGYYEIKFKPYYFYNIFKSRVTNELHDYLKIQADQDTTLFMADAGICISWDDLGEWTMEWEKYVDKYPNGGYTNAAKELYSWYIQSYLLGSDNTRPFDFDFENGKVIFYETDAYNRLLNKYPKSKTAQLLNAYLDKMKKMKLPKNDDRYSGILSQTYDTITEMIEKAVEKW